MSGRKATKTRQHELWGHCRYCRCKVALAEATVDHVIPASLFAEGQPFHAADKDHPANICLACSRCNELKADQYLAAFLMDLGTGPLKRRRRRR